MARFIVSLVVVVCVSCTADKALPRDEGGELRVLARAPDARGRHLCELDSIATGLSGRASVDCNVGGDTTYTVENDTIVYVSRYETAPDADPKLSMLDYWKTYLASEWERRLGGRPTNISQDRRADFVYFEAYWDRSDGTRELLSVSWREPAGGSPSRRVVRRVTLDCRRGGPIGCR